MVHRANRSGTDQPADGAGSTGVDDVGLLTEVATAFMEAETEHQVYARLGEALRQVVGDDAIINISRYDPAKHTFGSQVLLGLGPVAERATALLGRRPETLAGEYPPSVRTAMASGRLTRIPGGVSELVGMAAPAEELRRVAELLGLQDAYVIGFERSRLADGIAIVCRRPGMHLRTATLEALARMASVAIERKRAEAATREARALMEAVVDNVPQMVFLKEATELRLVVFNRASEETLGHDRTQLLGKSNNELFPPEQAAHFIAKDREVLDGPTGFLDIPEELVLTAKKGQRTFHTRKLRLRGADGETKYLLGVSEDITERQQVERALRASEARFREIINASPVPMALNDEQQRITFLNPAFVQTFGYTREDIPTLSEWWPRAYPDPVYRQQTAQRWEAELQRSQRSGTPFAAQEFSVRAKDGTTRSVLISAAPLSASPAGEHLVVMVDLSERKKLEAELAQADRLASMGLLAAGVGHEVNNPLSFVLANLEALVEGLPQLAPEGAGLPSRELLDELIEAARSARDGTLRIREISRGLSTFSRVDAVAAQPVDVVRALEAAATMAQNELRFRARVVRDYAAVPAVLANEGKLAQVFLNLLINAAHAIGDGPPQRNQVTLRVRSEGGAVVVEVADTGPGIAPEHLQRIFEPFFGTRPAGGGAGLGLAISHSIVTGFGGTLTVESTVGHGAQFFVRLPVAGTSALPKREVPGPQPSGAPGPRGRVLLVDDEEAIRSTLARRLRRRHEVVTAASGREGLAELERDATFDVIVCDLMMPDLTGMDLHAWLLAHDPALAERVIFVTGGAFTPQAEAYLARVGNLRLEKPFDGAALDRLVDERVAAVRAAAGRPTS